MLALCLMHLETSYAQTYADIRNRPEPTYLAICRKSCDSFQ